MSTILTVAHLNLHFGQRIILNDASFNLQDGQVVGVVGRNGTGKSTLLKLLAGLLESDSGQIIRSNGLRIGYLPQDFTLDPDATVLQAVLQPNPHFSVYGISTETEDTEDLVTREDRAKLLLQNLMCPPALRTIADLSGGERRKVELCRVLLDEPNLLLLDEPTNHLDIPSIERLENLIRTFTGTVLIVSHDRYFLDRVTNTMLELHQGQLFTHAGNYTAYLENKAIRVEIEATQDTRRLAHLKREVQWVRAGVQARGTKDKGRLQRFYDTRNQAKFAADPQIEMLLPPTARLGNKILKCINLRVEVDHKIVLHNFTFEFQPGTVLGLIGANGSGKTSLVRTIIGEREPAQGKIVVGLNTEFNYIDQDRTALNSDQNPFMELGQGQETTRFGTGSISTRGYLKRFGFDYERMQTPIGQLSGGEKARVTLAKTLQLGGNFIILDEPTNDLDLETLTALEESILQFMGCAIVISHDRYFLNRVCNWILGLEGEGDFVLTSGGYDRYLERRPASTVTFDPTSPNTPDTKLSAKHRRQTERDRVKQVTKLEKQIELQEAKLKGLVSEFAAEDYFAKNQHRLAERAHELEIAQQLLDSLILEWSELAGD